MALNFQTVPAPTFPTFTTLPAFMLLAVRTRMGPEEQLTTYLTYLPRYSKTAPSIRSQPHNSIRFAVTLRPVLLRPMPGFPSPTIICPCLFTTPSAL